MNDEIISPMMKIADLEEKLKVAELCIFQLEEGSSLPPDKDVQGAIHDLELAGLTLPINTINRLLKRVEEAEADSAALWEVLTKIDEEEAPRLNWGIPTGKLSSEKAYERGRAEIDEWLGDIMPDYLSHPGADLLARMKRLEEVLEFYVNKNLWHDHGAIYLDDKYGTKP